MFKKLVISGAFVLAAGPAMAATAGLSCADGAKIDFSVAGEAYALSDTYGACEIGFEVSGGYWSVATSEDGMIQGASGGYSSQEGADAASVAACEAEGADACTVTAYGFDDGSGPAEVEMAEEEMIAEEPVEVMVEEEVVEEMAAEDMMEEEEPSLVAKLKAIVLVVEVSEAE